jgi:hypothetical protein
MSFESKLYQSMCQVYPAMTVRAFSVIMGKSEGYWSSITAQGLMASTDSLVNLYDAISAKKILIEQSSAAHKRLTAIQDMIRTELTDRFLDQTGFAAPAQAVNDSDALYGAMPFAYTAY